MRNNPDSHELLSTVTTVHHERIGETLNDGTLSLAETLGSVPTGRVWEVDRLTNLNVITG